MNRRRFYIELLFLTIGVGVVLFLLGLLPAFAPYLVFSAVTLLAFALLSLVLYYLAVRAAVSKNKHAFTQLVMGFSFGKMLLAVLLVAIYKTYFLPPGNLFVVSFFVIYLAYTIFETIYMSKLGKIKAR